MRLIDAEVLADNAYEIYVHASPEFKERMVTLKMLIDNAPTIDAVPVVHEKDIRSSVITVKDSDEWQDRIILADEATQVCAVYYADDSDAVPVDIVADMLAYMFNDECPCNYNDVDEWLPYVCENTETCPDVVGKHSCWKQFIKHWMNREGEEDD